MTSVTLVGGAGFIGTSVAGALRARGDRVAVFDTRRRLDRAGALLDGVGTVAVDGLTKREIARHLEGSDVLIHLAWSSQPADSMLGMVEDASENIVGSINLFNEAAMVGVRRIIFASSGGTVYGNTDRVPIPEDRSLNPVSAYGVSKAAVERYLQLLAFHHGFNGISLRVGNPYGPYQLVGVPIGVMAHFIRRAVNGEPLKIYGDGSVVRDYVSIRDVAEAFAIATVQPLASGEYNIGSGKGLSINEVADLVEREVGRRPLRDYAPNRTFDAQRVVLDITRFSAATGWTPATDICDGIREMIGRCPVQRTAPHA